MTFEPSAFVADPDLFEALAQRATSVACSQRQTLFSQGDLPEGIFLITQGQVTLTMCSDTGETVFSVKAPTGSLLGLPGLIGNQPYSLSAVAEEDTVCAFVSRDAFTALMQSDPMLSLKILQVLAAEVRSARRAIANL